MTRIGSWITFTFWIVLIQIFVLSYVEVGGYLSPYLYPLILILAPANFNRYGLLLLGGLLGLGIDFHEGSGGLHLMASSALAYGRSWMLNAVVPRAAEEQLPFAPQVAYVDLFVVRTAPCLAVFVGKPRRAPVVAGGGAQPA
jgi:hypothetical protein